jgi:hypothetical protein
VFGCKQLRSFAGKAFYLTPQLSGLEIKTARGFWGVSSHLCGLCGLLKPIPKSLGSRDFRKLIDVSKETRKGAKIESSREMCVHTCQPGHTCQAWQPSKQQISLKLKLGTGLNHMHALHLPKACNLIRSWHVSVLKLSLWLVTPIWV